MEMEEQKNIFNSLGPVNLGKNEQVYTEALNYAISNDEIKNIAITGTYASGKSSVWETFKDYKKFNVKDVLTVSLGNYENINEKINENRVKEIDNRVERQIINQILSQINASDIPLSKYSFKENKSEDEINHQVSMTFLFLVSLMLLYFNQSILNVFNLQVNPSNIFFLLLIAIVLFVSPVGEFLHYVFKNHKFKFLKIKIKEAEADLNYQNGDDETILDRNIKEIVYLLATSRAKIVAFEDLDRFNNVEIFVKLKEFNFLVNAYLKTTNQNRVVKFVYLIKDGLFSSKDRTKFFDFILPIVPILDSKTSANAFLKLIKNEKSKQDTDSEELHYLKDSTVVSISTYVDDMRLLKNIVNEYNIYSRILPIRSFQLDKNKLFALITLKNIFPNEFELLQENKGYIKHMFDEVERYRARLIKESEDGFSSFSREKRKDIREIENKIHEKMASLIPSDIKIKNIKNSITWKKFLQRWSAVPERTVIIIDKSNEYKLGYEEFLEKYIFSNDNDAVVREIKLDMFEKNYQQKELERKIIEKQEEEEQIKSAKCKELLKRIHVDEQNQFFNQSNYKITEDYYFPLIKYLLSSGLLDETYWQYKSSFVDKFSSLKLKDKIFLLGLYENRFLDVLYEVESPKEIIESLTEFDYSRPNLLNITLLKQCLKDNNKNYVRSVTEAANINGNYSDLIKVIEELNEKECKDYVNILIDLNLLKELRKILKSFKWRNNKSGIKLLHYIFVNDKISNDDLCQFKEILEINEMTTKLILKTEIDSFFKKISEINVKFKTVANLDKYLIKRIELNMSYKLSVENVIIITENILSREINYGSLLNEIYNNEELKYTKQYVNQNFHEFMSLYIKGNQNGEYFINDEKIVVNLLKSSLTDDEKLKYLEFNKVQLSDFVAPLSAQIIIKLIRCNTLIFSVEMVSMLWWNIKKIKVQQDQISAERYFVQYINFNANEETIHEIFDSNNDLINYIINSLNANQFVFNCALQRADKNNKIENIKYGLKKGRLEAIINNELLATNSRNLEIILRKGYIDEAKRLINKLEKVEQKNINKKLLKSKLPDNVISELKKEASE